MKLLEEIIMEENKNIPKELSKALTELTEDKVDREFLNLETMNRYLKLIDNVDEPAYEVLSISLEQIIKISDIKITDVNGETISTEDMNTTDKIVTFVKNIWKSFLIVVNKISTYIKKWLSKIYLAMSHGDENILQLKSSIDRYKRYTIENPDETIVKEYGAFFKGSCFINEKTINLNNKGEAYDLIYNEILKIVRELGVEREFMETVNINENRITENSIIIASYPGPTSITIAGTEIDADGKYHDSHITTYEYLMLSSIRSEIYNRFDVDLNALSLVLSKAKKDTVKKLIDEAYTVYKNSVSEFKTELNKFTDPNDILELRKWYLYKLKVYSKSIFNIVRLRNSAISLAEFILNNKDEK